jgi:hypothetical protein
MRHNDHYAAFEIVRALREGEANARLRHILSKKTQQFVAADGSDPKSREGFLKVRRKLLSEPQTNLATSQEDINRACRPFDRLRMKTLQSLL